MPKREELKTFALIWAFIFAIIGLLPLVNNGEIKVWSLIVSSLFLVIALLKPEMLTQFYKIWVKVGDFVGNIISRVIMFMLYFGFFTPISLVLKLLGKDLLNKKIDKSQESYWVERKTQPQSMKNQF